MTFRDRIIHPEVASLFQRRTIRLRLSAVYGLLFLLSTAVLLAITYLLVDHAGGLKTLSSGGQTQPSNASGPTVLPSGATQPLNHQLPQTYAHSLTSSQHAQDLHHLLVYSAVAVAIMAGVSILLGWVVAGRVLRPLRTITSTAREISATNLHRRLALIGPDDELKELGDTFDDLLGRLETFIVAQRQFVANASHELRTPLAWQRTLVQVALDDPEADMASRRVTLERVLASGAQQQRLIEALLTLASSESGIAEQERIDLSIICDSVLLRSHLDTDTLGLHFETAISPAPLIGDPRLIERLVTNLIDNALRYNVPGGQVDITTTTQDGRAVLVVANTGPPVPSEDIERLVQPFQRHSPERTSRGDGFGLGLSIVAAIANAHRADLQINPRPTGGLDVEVRFPPPTNPVAGDPRATSLYVTAASAPPSPLDTSMSTKASRRRGRGRPPGRTAGTAAPN